MSECNHFWRAVDSRRSQCSKCGEITKAPCREPECAKMQGQIATLQAENAALDQSLQERWENLNVQDGVIAKQQEEIAALRAEEALTDAMIIKQSKLLTGVANALYGVPKDPLFRHSHHDLPEVAVNASSRIAALEKVAEAAVNLAKDKRPDTIYNPLLDNLEKALRSAGDLKEEGDE